MKIKLNIKPKIAYLASIFTAIIILLFFSYKAVIAYIIHRELYGGGLDTLVLLRASIAGIMFLLILLFIQFMKINDLKSQRTILRGIFIGWTSVFVAMIVLKLSSIYFVFLTGLSSLIILITLFSLIDQIKEEKNTLTDKEIYLLQKLAKKKNNNGNNFSLNIFNLDYLIKNSSRVLKRALMSPSLFLIIELNSSF